MLEAENLKKEFKVLRKHGIILLPISAVRKSHGQPICDLWLTYALLANPVLLASPIK
jgi:uncharacterized protein related to proFAR isomerase